MIFILYIMILLIIIFLLFLLKNKNIIVTIFCSLLIIQIIITPKLCIDGAVSGALLFFYKVFPSLFSFLIVCNVIMAYDGIYIYSKIFGSALCTPLRLPKSCSFVLIISLLCGYPLGAKYACDLYEKGIIDLSTCERLLNIASNASPLFILGSVGISMLNDSNIGYLLLLSNIFSCFAMGFFIPANISIQKKSLKRTHNYSDLNIGDVFKSSIENSIKTCLSIGGFITIFSVVNSILKSNHLFTSVAQQLSILFHIPINLMDGFLLGLIEMTNGCSLISSANSALILKIALISFLFTFSGLSIISQVYSFTYKFDISMKKYILRKTLQGLLSSLISILLFNFFYSNKSNESFNVNYSTMPYIRHGFFIVFIILIIIPWFIFKVKELFHVS